MRRLDEQGLRRAVEQLCRAEPRFETVVAGHGLPSLRLADNSLASLLRIVTEQLISLKAAAAIWARLESELDPFRSDAIAVSGIERLRKAGLSGAKARCFLALANLEAEGRLGLETLAGLEDEAARRHLLALPGIGPWTADIYLLTVLARPDIFPAGDRALQLSAGDLFGLGVAPDARQLALLAEAWKPWRAVAARLLWSHYRGLRNMPQAV
jgi:DNA-3-methyladenine glycosylase II